MPEVKSTEHPATPRPWLVLAILCIGFFMALLDGSIVNVAVPTLIHSLNASYDEVLWVIDGYLLVFSVPLITTGRLGDVVGRRRLYVLGVITFTVASASCGLADSPTQLLIARLAQGLGGALLFPQVISAIVTIFPPGLRGRAFGLFGAIVGFAPIVGPVVGGVVLTHLGWRWIFFVNVPVGIVTVVLALTFVPPLRTGRAQRLDLVGVVLATAGLGGVVFGLIEGERYGWGRVVGPISIASVIVTGVALLVVFVLWQHRQRGEALMPLALFRGRDFAVGNAVGFVFQLGMIGIMFVLVLYLQMARGYSALETGLVVLPNAVLTAVGSAGAGRLSDRFGGGLVLMAGLVSLAVGLLVLVVMVGPTSGVGSLLPGLLIIGVASGATFAPLQQATMHGVDPRLAGAASGVSSTIRQVGGVLGTAVLGVLLSASLSSALRGEAEKRAGQLPENLRDQFVEASAAAARHYSPPSPPGDLNPATASLYERVAGEAFSAGFVNAMRSTLVACAVVLVVAALFCFLFSSHQKPTAVSAPGSRPEPASRD
ncbi:drug resistance transporter, EmrB/QacA subfamily [Streptoalloteichus tenebrarius]|uniref:Drug resistance transporter, EmrB/QacA subfamily n=1 Tax=Streptoalloteichus tenebrarius (strain ATCC 17920 / DSM 40477 / JCM 4838 / CBS 697.72 / NBRC 16177 / NCIMB 11028 / NRRL B-12390 / A12253. 1 / ISP 5477) TaxID=1933 RepID=A0ABT1HQ96_STRSD|nr:DHA2 family efflux MFS transporter permease subunit [Streptoalloteichus tenebrarius]MCP2257668.1 drug resistance transporter, EmrB/QacA subfamily [Streptoalloteichus tenebrarius]